MAIRPLQRESLLAMTDTASLYRELAARSRVEADNATLFNVQERALRLAAAFEEMAIQQETVAKKRAKRETASTAAAKVTRSSVIT